MPWDLVRAMQIDILDGHDEYTSGSQSVMQKFHKNDPASIYQDVFMSPGYTHEPFFDLTSQLYPWHQYYADTDCIWLAAEYPLRSP